MSKNYKYRKQINGELYEVKVKLYDDIIAFNLYRIEGLFKTRKRIEQYGDSNKWYHEVRDWTKKDFDSHIESIFEGQFIRVNKLIEGRRNIKKILRNK